MRLRGAYWLVLLGSGCLTEYTVGQPANDVCGAGQVMCSGGCVTAETCDDGAGCPMGQVKCGSECAPPDTCLCDQGCDAEYEVCQGEVCMCRLGLTRCEGVCVDTRVDPAHCGRCGEACAEDEPLCSASDCVATCEGSQVLCGGGCVDTAVDSLHCGMCGKVCKSDEVCLARECRTFDEISGCIACPCEDACDEFESDDGGVDSNAGGQCCDSPFVGGPVCVEDGCE